MFLLLILLTWLQPKAEAQPTAQQFKEWLYYYSHGDLRADYNYDGILTPADFPAFIENYDSPPDGGYRSQGWTQILPSSATRMIYVSSAAGNDNNDGRSITRPVKTIARAYDLIRDGQPDWILLRRGDTFFESLPNWKKSGRSFSEPMVLTTYGSNVNRPRVLTGDTRAMRATGPETRKHLRFVGIEFEPHTRTRDQGPGGIEFICHHEDILIEDCKIIGYADNLQFQGDDVRRANNVRVRRNVIVDSWAVGQHSQGLYAARVDNILIEENIFDHNGWNENIAGAEPTIFNHNVYIQSSCSGVNVLGNIIANGSSHGVQARPGGNVIGNFFYRNAINVLLGNEDFQTTGAVNGNVIMEGKDIGPGLPRGMGIHVQNSNAAKIRDNLILRNGTEAGQSEAIAIIGDSDKLVKDLMIERNTIYNWLNNFVIENEAVRNATFRSNVVFDNQNQSPAVRHFETSTLDDVVAYNNTYQITGTNSWFRARNSYYNLNQWLTVSNESSPFSFSNRRFNDPSRTLATYAQNLLLPADAKYVILRARGQNRVVWDDSYSAYNINTYLKQGYTLVPR